MRGITSAAAYVPFRRLDRSQISGFLGTGGGRGTRSVASHDEDTTTMGVEAARLALRAAPAAAPDALWFATSTPAYHDKTNATAIHAALRQERRIPAYDFGGALRSGVGALQAALAGSGSVLVVSADRRDGLPGSADEAGSGDAGAALLVGEGDGGRPVLAEHVASATATDEFVDRWRAPGEARSRLWEERFGENRYVALGAEAWADALKQGAVSAQSVDRVVVTGMHARATKVLAGRLGLAEGALADDLAATVGRPGAAHPALVVTSMLEEEATLAPAGGRLVAVVHLADGADVVLLRTTAALGRWRPGAPVAAQVAAGAPLSYAKFLAWRGMLELEPPRRPEPARVSSSAAWRSEDWKFGFVGSKDRRSGALHMPPARVSMQGGAVDDMVPVPMADATGTIVTFTIDRMVYSPSPPVVFAIVDFDGGGRFPVELTDVDAEQVAIGDRVEMTFRRLFTADGIHDYFWKARPHRAAGEGH